jgi:hypothetical protein
MVATVASNSPIGARTSMRRRAIEMTKYQTVDTSTLAGLKKAERLHAQGWTCYSVGLFTMKFSKKFDSKKGASK